MRNWVLCVFLSVCTLGCGAGSNGRFPVSGNVTLADKPLKSGTIEFEATDGSHRSGTVITDGKYSIPAPQGLRPATYTVKVSAVESQQGDSAAPPGPESMGAEQSNKELIPAEFNRNSTLKYESGAGKPVTFDVKIP
ncbi:MAG: hypothetical protein U0941_01990 [Planctomycetaceae bacterium]